MAKQMNKLPSVEQLEDIGDNPPCRKIDQKHLGPTVPATVKTVMIELPIFTGPVSKHLGGPDYGRVECPSNCFTADDILALRRLYMALTEFDVKLKSGTRVEKGTNHAVRYVLERLTDAVEQSLRP